MIKRSFMYDVVQSHPGTDMLPWEMTWAPHLFWDEIGVHSAASIITLTYFPRLDPALIPSALPLPSQRSFRKGLRPRMIE